MLVMGNNARTASKSSLANSALGTNASAPASCAAARKSGSSHRLVMIARGTLESFLIRRNAVVPSIPDSRMSMTIKSGPRVAACSIAVSPESANDVYPGILSKPFSNELLKFLPSIGDYDRDSIDDRLPQKINSPGCDKQSTALFVAPAVQYYISSEGVSGNSWFSEKKYPRG